MTEKELHFLFSSLIGNLGEIFGCLKLSVLQFFLQFHHIYHLPNYGSIITIIMSCPRLWLECLGSVKIQRVSSCHKMQNVDI